jgi:ABC-type sugar transport system ATPase subunit
LLRRHPKDRFQAEQVDQLVVQVALAACDHIHDDQANSPAEVRGTLGREQAALAGLVGAGRTELLRAIFGLDPVRRGQIRVTTFTSQKCSPRQRIDQGVGLLSEDRKREGLATFAP